MSSPVQRTYSRPSLVGSIVNPCPTPTPPFIPGGNIQGDGPPTSDPPNVFATWYYLDRLTLQTYTWNNETFLWV